MENTFFFFVYFPPFSFFSFSFTFLLFPFFLFRLLSLILLLNFNANGIYDTYLCPATLPNSKGHFGLL